MATQVKKTPAHHGLSTTGLLFYNALLSLPLLAVSLAASPEPARILAFPGLMSPGLHVRSSCMVLYTCMQDQVLVVCSLNSRAQSGMPHHRPDPQTATLSAARLLGEQCIALRTAPSLL